MASELCAQTRDKIFRFNPEDLESSPHLDKENVRHLGECKECDQYHNDIVGRWYYGELEKAAAFYQDMYRQHGESFPEKLGISADNENLRGVREKMLELGRKGPSDS